MNPELIDELHRNIANLAHRLDDDIQRLRHQLANEERERLHLEDTVRRLEREVK